MTTLHVQHTRSRCSDSSPRHLVPQLQALAMASPMAPARIQALSHIPENQFADELGRESVLHTRQQLGVEGLQPSPSLGSSAIPSLRHDAACLESKAKHNMATASITRPASLTSPVRPSITPRTRTDPSYDRLPTHHPRSRERSPLSRAPLRSTPVRASHKAPPMMRAHSLPAAPHSAAFLGPFNSPAPGRPSSPLRSPQRARSPRSQPLHDLPAGTPSVCDISEDAELQITPHAGLHHPSPAPSLYSSIGPLPRRRRPASPLHHVALGSSAAAPTAPSPTLASSSPLLSAVKFNEPFPGLSSHYASSYGSISMPSTPTSLRSRSPSISSLETIPDTPDAEMEAIEADRLAKLESAVREEAEDGYHGGRSSLDMSTPIPRTLNFGKRDSRKRWSVCGAERRSDLDLETIWED